MQGNLFSVFNKGVPGAHRLRHEPTVARETADDWTEDERLLTLAKASEVKNTNAHVLCAFRSLAVTRRRGLRSICKDISGLSASERDLAHVPHIVPYRKQICVAEVGKEITNWQAHAGTVLAIIETTQLVFVHTHAEGGPSVPPVLVSPGEVLERTYFDDFPAPARPLPKRQAR
jgi:hypothetical protein